MNLTKVISYFFLLVALGLGVFLFMRVKTKIDEEKRIERVENQIKRKLVMIRDAQIAYQAIHGEYTSDWDELINFIDTGRIYITERREYIKTLEYGADSVWTEVDTLGAVPVRDSLFSEQKYPNFNPETLPYIPGKENTRFEIFTGKVTKSGVEVDVIEVRDVDPINPKRSEENEAFSMKPLRFGSRTDVTTSGNWE